MKPIRNLGLENSIFNQFLAEIRSEDAQGDSMRFRRNLERLGEIFAYEISKTMEYEKREVTTPLGIANIKLPKEKPVLATILRAGLPLHQGLLNISTIRKTLSFPLSGNTTGMALSRFKWIICQHPILKGEH